MSSNGKRTQGSSTGEDSSKRPRVEGSSSSSGQGSSSSSSSFSSSSSSFSSSSSSSSRGQGGSSSGQDGAKRILFYPFGSELERRSVEHRAAKILVDGLNDASAKVLVEAVGKAVDATINDHKEANRAPGGQTRLPFGQADKPDLPKRGKEIVDAIAVHFDKVLRRMKIDPFFGGNHNDLMMKAILYYILPPFCTVSLKFAENYVGGTIKGLAIVLTSPSAPGSNPLKTPTGREIGKLVAIVTAVDKELRSVLLGDECPSPMPTDIFVLDLLGFNAKEGGEKVLPKLADTHDTATVGSETSSLSLVARSLTASIVSSTDSEPIVDLNKGILIALVDIADDADDTYVDSEDEGSSPYKRRASSSSNLPPLTGVEHSARIRALGSKALDPFARIMAEQSRNADTTLLIMQSTRKIKSANANWSTAAGVEAEKTLSHICTTTRVRDSKAERVRLALLVLGWREGALKKGLALLGDESELAGVVAGSAAFHGSLSQVAKLRKQNLVTRVKYQVRISRDAARLIPKTSELYPHRTELGKLLASHMRPRQLGGVQLSEADKQKPTTLTRSEMDTILKPYWEINMRSDWTEDYSNQTFNSWSSGQGMENLRRLSSAIYALSDDNPFHALAKLIKTKLRTLCSSSPESGKRRFLRPEQLKVEIIEIYEANPNLTRLMREPTFGDFNEANQYWGGSGKGTVHVLEMETNDITDILNPLFTKIGSALFTIRKGKRLAWPLSRDVLLQLDAATLTVLKAQSDFSSITELPEGFAAEVYKYANGYRGKSQLNSKLTN